MKTHTFKGGIHPSEMKELTKNCEIKNSFPSTNLVWIPVTQGGAPNTPTVKAGDVVKRGQVIACSDDHSGDRTTAYASRNGYRRYLANAYLPHR